MADRDAFAFNGIKNACYHIIARGNNRQRIFRENEDYEKYLSLVRKYKRKYKCRIFGYCIMPNHIHFVLETANKERLISIMRSLQRAYTSYFNRKYRFFGHLWQGRFKSKIILKDRYLLDCIAYVEANPLRANMISSLHDYRWSSYRVRVLNEKNDIIDELGDII